MFNTNHQNRRYVVLDSEGKFCTVTKTQFGSMYVDCGEI